MGKKLLWHLELYGLSLLPLLLHIIICCCTNSRFEIKTLFTEIFFVIILCQIQILSKINYSRKVTADIKKILKWIIVFILFFSGSLYTMTLLYNYSVLNNYNIDMITIFLLLLCVATLFQSDFIRRRIMG